MPKIADVKFSFIKKRDGRVSKFDKTKITQSLLKAGTATGEYDDQEAKNLTEKVLGAAEKQLTSEIPSVEEIQDIVEEVLLSSRFKKTAKAYILYRDQHAKLREIANQSHVDLMDDYLDKLDWQVKENSNMAYSLQGLNNYVASEITKTYWLDKIYPNEIGHAHRNGDLHIHDLNLLAVYCVGWDLQDVLNQGFRGVSGKVESKPAKHLSSALGQIVNFFYTLQGESAGAQAFSNFDTFLAPFIRYDKLDYNQTKQLLQEFVFNLNVPTRVGFQTPFTNLTLDLTVPNMYKNSLVMIGGEVKDERYGDFQKEMDMFNRAFLEVMLEGDAKGRVFTFPIPTYNITPQFDWDNPLLDLLWKVTAQYGTPYFANFVNSEMSVEDARSMCCRLRLDLRSLQSKGGGLFGAHPLTGSIGVVTINLPRLGYRSQDKSQFFTLLTQQMDLAKQALEIKRKVLESFNDADLYPYAKHYLRNIKKRFGHYWSNHFSTIGIIGMNEACLNLLAVPITHPDGHHFATEVLDFMREKLVIYQEETGHNYNLEATPAEGTSYRLAKLDKQKHPDIIVANEDKINSGAKPYYTNSTHLPVNYTNDIFEALDLQDSLQTRYTGGTVLHGFLGEQMPSPEATKQLVKKIVNNYHLPYFTLTPTFSICPTHGYLPGEHFYCPKCDQENGYIEQDQNQDYQYSTI